MTRFDSSSNMTSYGVGDTTYQAAGGIEGITALVDCFYNFMDTLPEAKTLRDMHDKDLTLSRKKLSYFLSGWMGGPRLYAEHFGPISIPKAHSHLPVDMDSKNAWLLCMGRALDKLNYPAEFKDYVIKQLSVPAESIRRMAEQNNSK